MAIFDHAHQKSLNQLLAFLNLYQHAKNQFITSAHFWDTVSFKVPWPDTQFWPCPPKKNFDQLLIFVNLHHHAKKQLFNLFILQVQSVWVPSPGWAHPFLTMPSPKIFNHILICMNFYQHTKNQLIPSVHSWDTVNFRVQRHIGHTYSWPCPTKRFSINF